MVFEGFGVPADSSGIRCAMTGPMYHSAPNAYGPGGGRGGGTIYLQARFDAEDCCG